MSPVIQYITWTSTLFAIWRFDFEKVQKIKILFVYDLLIGGWCVYYIK